MTPEKFKALIEKLDMSQIDVARFLDFDGRQVRRWVAGEVPVPFAVEAILTYLVKTGLSPEEFLRICGIRRRIDLI